MLPSQGYGSPTPPTFTEPFPKRIASSSDPSPARARPRDRGRPHPQQSDRTTPAHPAESRCGQHLPHVPASLSQDAHDWLAALLVARGGRAVRRPALPLVVAAAAVWRARRGGVAGGGGTGGGCRFRNRRSSSLTRGLRGLGRVGPRRAGPLEVEAAWAQAGWRRRYM